MLVYIKPLSIFPKLTSDTIFGAIISAISELYPNLIEDLIEEFKEVPPFLISSAFPFIYNGEEKVRFFPKIIINEKIENYKFSSETIDNKKKFKKVHYVEEEIFFKMASGHLKESDIVNNFENYRIHGNLLSKSNLRIQGKYKDTIIPNNTINRITQESDAIFYTEGYEFKNVGLFFLLDIFEDKYENIIRAAIKFLKDRGFGKDISTGKGHFDFEIKEYDFKDYDFKKNERDYFITLSRFIPNKEDISNIDENSSYELGSKRGISSSGELKKQVRFFKEGSIFPNYNNYYGRIVESGKHFPSIEYGFAFPIKFKRT